MSVPAAVRRAGTPAAERGRPDRERLSRRDRWTVGGMGGTVLTLHLLGFGMLAFALAQRPPGHHQALTLGLGFLAYSFGLRHAFDADHIAAIDNTTRKFLAEGRRRLSTGLFFSLGHSTVVLGLAVALSFAARAVFGQVTSSGSTLQSFGGLVGTLVSGGFLYLIALLNLVVLIGILRVFRDMRNGAYDGAELERQLNARGMMNRFFGGLMKAIRAPWQMYPVGVLFGLGFDTATEVALLALTAGAASTGLPWYAICSLPLIFAAGMSLMDSADGAFMAFAYDWAFAKPLRKIYYNITITGLSVAIALIIGTIELLSIVAYELHITGGILDWSNRFNINTAGFFIVGLFVLTWIVALTFWHVGKVEERWAPAVRD